MINDVVIYWCFTIFNFNKIHNFRLLIYLALHTRDRQMSQTFQPQITESNIERWRK